MRLALCILMLMVGRAAGAQQFQLLAVHDSLSLLILSSETLSDTLRLPYPVYRFCTGDINGDGLEEALVGVVKSTRYYAEKERRLFILKNHGGRIRNLWRGSRVGRRLIDFKLAGQDIRCLMQMNGNRYSVADFTLARFGLQFLRFIIRDTSEEDARKMFEQAL